MVTQPLLESGATSGQALPVVIRELAAAVDAYCAEHKKTRADIAKDAGMHEKALIRALRVAERKSRKLSKPKAELARPRQSTVKLSTAEDIAAAIGRRLVLTDEEPAAEKGRTK